MALIISELDLTNARLDAVSLQQFVDGPNPTTVTTRTGLTFPSLATFLASVSGGLSSPKWTTARTLAVTGAVSFSMSVDGSANVSVASTIPDGSVALGKITTIATSRLLGNVSGSTASPVALTASQVKSFLGLSLSDLNTAAGFSVGRRGIPPTVHDANYTFVLTDAGTMARHTSGTGHAYTIPPISSVAFEQGDAIMVRNVGAGAVTITRGSGVTLRKAGSGTSQDIVVGQWGEVTIIMEANDTWVSSGAGQT